MSIGVHPWLNSRVVKQKFKLTIAYDGTAYQGWQWQKTGTGVQEKVEAALAKLFPSKPRIHGSSRTDTGVHALGMVAHFEIPRAEFKMTTARLALALNAWLPADIRVFSASRAPAKFHARFDDSALHVLTPRSIVQAKTSYGGTSPESVRRQIKKIKQLSK